MWEKIQQTWAQPFRPEMSAFDWFLFFGVVIVISALWRILLGHILDGVGD